MDRPASRPGSRRRVAWIAGGGVLLVGLALSIPSLSRWLGTEMAVSAAQLRFGIVTRGDLVREVSAQGSVIAAFRPNLTSPARGTADVLLLSSASPGTCCAPLSPSSGCGTTHPPGRFTTRPKG
ncbi:MAG TPA: hypothetical protein VM778_07460 [Gemmatimonadota bacterium]|nr:hypothetical protein [Gemmatimonadota bacterium]